MNRTATTTMTRTAAVLAATVLSGSLACVTSDTYNAALAERDALSRQKSDLEREVAALAEQVSELETSEQKLAKRLEEREREVSELRGTYDELVDDLRAELDSGKVQIEQLRDGIRLSVADEILFPSGSAALDERGRTLLVKVAAQLKTSPHRIEVEGHTDDVPIRASMTARYPTNWELAAARASSVVRLLQEQGVDGKRLRAISRGEYQPVAANESEEGRAKNRRIEIRLTPQGEQGVATHGDKAAPGPSAARAD